MKFAQRLSCAVLLLLAGVFSLGGFVLVYINAADMLRQAAAQVEQWHRMQYYTLETQVLGMMARGEDVTDDALLESAMRIADFGEDGSQSGIWLENSDGIMLFSSLGAAAAEASASVGPIGAQEYYLRRAQGNTYLLLESTISAPNKSYRLRTLSDVTGVFVARDRQLARFWCMEAGALGGGALAIVLLTKRMTRPLDELYGASRRIARGDYSARAEVATQDEIGSVAESFNAMAAAVQKNVDALALSARQREECMGAFTHELKTPMTAIIGYADTLRTLELDPEGRRRAAGYIFSEAKRVEALSGKLLALLGLAQKPAALAPVQMDRVLRQLSVSLAPVLGPVKLDLRGEKGLCALGDEDLLVDLLYNLVHNAQKAAPKDGMVHVLCTRAPGGVLLCVRDTGCGIPKEELCRVTEPFYMVDKSRARKAGGSGMGLALCQKIAALHGAQLCIESQVGVGTRVSFTLKPAKEVPRA